MDLAEEIVWTPERQAIRFLSDPSPQLVWLTDATGFTIYVNPLWSSVTGQSYDQALGHGWLDIIHPDDRVGTLSAVGRAHNDRLPHHTRYRIRRYEGHYEAVLATAHPLFDKVGEYIGYVGSNSMIENAGNAPQPDRKSSGAFILSSRERAVLMLVAAGLTAEEIATKLAIAARTVEYHIHSSARKLKSNNRVQTVAKAAVLGEIDLSSAIGL
ncbi:MAG TPA: LuxR C-terminal-related transcriptional regulator [Devosia sp.]